MSEQLPLLIELGTEELPVKALPGLADALFEGIKAGLEKRGVAVDAREARPLFTPRRLAVLLPGVAVEQPEQASEVFGPYVNIALDADGQPTKALSGFAAKAGVDWTQLERTTDAKGERFVLRATRAGARTADLLPEVIAEAVAAMPIPKPMRWGDHDYAFARPVQWLVALLGEQVIDTTLMGVAAGRDSRGHRFEHDAPVSIAAPGDYVTALEAARVLVDPQQRRARIIEQVQAAARSVDGDARVTDDNLEQVVCLTEWPSAVACSFEPAFLAVPQEALIETMEINQKFFPVLRDGVLTEHFIGIANIASRDPAQVRAGYERVIRPRFADAKFFFDEDLKQGLVAMGEGLATVTYQAKLGTVADKVARVAALAQAIAPKVGADPALARRAAELSKNDLQSRMVGEFPELQGIAGRHYALAAGESQEVALAIDEGYQPRFAGDDIALSPLGKVLAIAERLDTLAGGFAAGLKPTGNKDPFALRRNALGLARTIIESGFDLDLKSLLATAVGLVGEAGPADKSKKELFDAMDKLLPELYDFILDRLKGYYADKGVPTTQFNAVAELKPASLYDFDRRIEAIGTFAALPEAAALAAANKRIGNILKKAQAEGVQIPDHLDRGLIEHPAEAALAEAVQAAIGDTDTALHQHDYVAVLARLALLREQVDSFFDMVMVNAENPAVRGNRLALLHRLHARFGKVADIAQLSA
ncbi:glycine--tRNA ligase subunit beta [Pseudoxanthomonas winnipegensis]|uniref:Glycine--tRNA ligase beta subunit n=1 Tax=Pseudoxanthomonas winnipegensis TaxID=2480810 RepID=A0A4V2HEH7_9GAMM|nr:glycine--tRNA ligase subunit beta [Pseudoxanthomonas winnipegensis]RZZ89702.1 glycine--tRNA ligase subunit beta [Pseudoxanthomonas winnipegensis]TAA32872.1 glycine--tRNA ligase subunit beta [Pseudoxanthomonas winnipegensis]TAA43116.1 glycine--tRNA ligase subunit beta [Pseudoxanthomonas winnipegensis]TBV78645.1 glycine--tRNA ligase subunit beta [Pseudoxanthomonas winnipegensis]